MSAFVLKQPYQPRILLKNKYQHLMKSKTYTFLLSIVFLLLILVTTSMSLAGNNRDFTLMFRSGNYHVPENLDDFTGSFIKQAAPGQASYYIVQFYEIPDRTKRETMAANGIALLDYIPNMAYFARISSNASLDQLTEFRARAVVEIAPEYKLDFQLFAGDYPEHAMRGENKIELFIHFPSDINYTEIIRAISAQGIEFSEAGFSDDHMLVTAPTDKISWLASQSYIFFIEPVYPPAEPENYTGRSLHRSTNLATDYLFGRKYTGAGINVMLQDDGIIGPHIDYQGRIGAQYISYNSGDHGDHIAGTIMGAGNLDPKARGMAPGSMIFVYGASGYQGFGLISSHYNSPGIRITSTSYSNGCNAGYTSLARTMDQQSRLYPSLMHVFSAGNDGTSNCGYGAGAGWGNITGGHKIGKNVIAVGNVNSTDVLAGSSSRGPAHDGRIKPEVVAKGTSVYSTTNPNLYTQKSGTSMACPGVSGTLAQLYHAYRSLNSGSDPNGGLMKATLMNTAYDLGNPGPDFRFGYGRINALRAAKNLEEFRYDSAVVEQGETVTHFLEIPEGTFELRVMVYWTDYEANTGASKALVNDLNMVVYNPDGEEFLPWVLDHTPNPVNLNTPAIRAVDNLNNVEQVTIKEPVAGTYEISVTGYLVPQGPQTYFLTWEFITDHVLVTYPAGGEALVPGESELIRWDASEGDDTFTLEYSTDNGETWMLITDNISPTQRQQTWIVPVAITNAALVRISRGDLQSISEHPFTIMDIPRNIKIDWSCQNSFRISWDPVYGASHYLVRMLGEKYMDVVGNTTQNSFIVSNVTTAETWVTVQAASPGGAVSQRPYAIRKQAGAFNCSEADLTAEAFTSAKWKVYHHSHNLSEFPVEIRIRNVGSGPVSDFTAGFLLNESEPIQETLGITLMPDSSAVIQFEGLYDFSEPGDYSIKAWVNHANDNNAVNDTIIQVVRVLSDDAVNPYPFYIQSFENFERCMPWPTCEQYSCNMIEGWTNLINVNEDQIDWRTYGGSTPTGGSGPTTDKTTGTAEGNYLYLEASVLCFNREAILLTPCFDLSTIESATMSFWYHMWGVNTGRLHVDAYAGNTIYFDVIPPIIGDQGNEWKQALIPLEQFLGGYVTFRFRGVTGPDQLSDIAIDDVEITTLVSVKELAVQPLQMNIYPNPNTGQFTMEINDPNPGILSVVITDLMGKAVYENQISTAGSSQKQVIDLSALPSGVYFVIAGSHSGQTQRKLIKQ